MTLHNSRRSVYLDTLGGLLLLYMIVLHCTQWAGFGNEFFSATHFLAFFMPWFFFKGGMFHKLKPMREVASTGYHRLIVPFICFSVIGSILLWGGMAINGEFGASQILASLKFLVLNGALPGNTPLWFLLSLFVVRIIFNWILKGMRSPILWQRCANVIALVSIGLLFIPIHYVSENYGVKIPAYFSNVSSGLFLYACGYFMRDANFSLSVSLLLAAAYVAISVFFPTLYDMRIGASDCRPYSLWILYAIFGIVASNALAKRIGDFPNVLSKIGCDSMPFYCMHWCVIVLVSIFFGTRPSGMVYLIALLMANAVSLPLLTRIIRKSRFEKIFG